MPVAYIYNVISYLMDRLSQNKVIGSVLKSQPRSEMETCSAAFGIYSDWADLIGLCVKRVHELSEFRLSVTGQAHERA